jgi:pyruvate dehydrogenase E1 component alpha subunit/2-oxoisovalerate dehydrogenase E1 component alpha subunit
MDAKLKQSLVGRDCLKVAEEYLLQQNWAERETLVVWRNEATQKVEQAVAKAQREPAPDPFAENWTALSSKHLSEGNE